MDKQISQCHIGITNIRLENMRSKEVIKIAASRMFSKKRSILMAWTIKRIIFFTYVFDKLTKKGGNTCDSYWVANFSAVMIQRLFDTISSERTVSTLSMY